jgi:hypothetical protein
VQVKEGGTLLAETQRTCDYSRRVPCTDLTARGSVAIATTGMPDGQHTVQIGATDAAGNFTAAATKTVTVDNHAPTAPTTTSPTQQTVSSPGATVSWQAPTGQAAPISNAHITVCGPRACRFATQAAGPADGSAAVSLTDGYGLYSVLVYLEDAAGNANVNAVASWNVNFPNPRPAPGANPTPAPTQPTQPTQPQPTPTPVPVPVPLPAPAPAKTSPRLTAARPTVARDHRTITMKGTVASGTTGRVTIKATAKIHGRTRTVTKRATIRNRRYAARIKLPATKWSSATLTVTFHGDATHRSARLSRRLTQRRN